jgi:Electron transfer DM13
MKKIIFNCMVLVFFLISCTKEGDFTKPLDENTSIINSVLLKSGAFAPTSGITVNGSAEVRMDFNEHYVELVNFNISPGPDLKVYLSKSNVPDGFVNLGALVSNKNIYSIPNGLVLSEYTHVLIHCQQYNHLFAVAQLN